MSTSPPLQRRGLLLVLSSPSGAGKTSLARKLLETDATLRMSVSVTTRKPRPGEIDGQDYEFIDQAEFDRRVVAGDLLEWARVFGNGYGTPKAAVVSALEHGQDVLFDIDWQGTQQLAARLPADLVRVFILPPSVQELRKRLQGRNQDPPDVVDARMSKAASEISHWAEYDYCIVNDDFERALAGLTAILAAERLKRDRQPGLMGFVQGLTDGL